MGKFYSAHHAIPKIPDYIDDDAVILSDNSLNTDEEHDHKKEASNDRTRIFGKPLHSVNEGDIHDDNLNEEEEEDDGLSESESDDSNHNKKEDLSVRIQIPVHTDNAIPIVIKSKPKLSNFFMNALQQSKDFNQTWIKYHNLTLQ